MKKKVAIIGASGYSGEELVRLLLHPSGCGIKRRDITPERRTDARTGVSEIRQSAARKEALRFSEAESGKCSPKQADVVFLALPHGVAAEYAVSLVQAGCIVIDLSADFRVKSAAVYKEFYAHDHPAPEMLGKSVYGLPEIYREQIKKATLIASPGCYPTSVLLPTIPLLKAGLLVKSSSIIADSLRWRQRRGSQGRTGLCFFVECNESVRPYGVPKHRHLSEIEQELSIAANTPVTIQFTPHLIPVNRGILTTLYFAPEQHFSNEAEMKTLGEKITACYASAYGNEPFVRLLERQRVARHKKCRGHKRPLDRT